MKLPLTKQKHPRTDQSHYNTKDGQYHIWKDSDGWWRWEHKEELTDTNGYRTRQDVIYVVVDDMKEREEENELWER